MASELKVDVLLDGSGNQFDGSQLGNVGKVLQVVNVEDKTRTQINSHDPIQLMSCTITPSSANSKILIQLSVAVGDTDDWGLRLTRNGTTIKGTGYSASYSDPNCFVCHDQFDMGNYEIYTMAWNFMDTPATTSPVTYILYSDSFGGNTGLFNYNRDNANTGAGQSSMTLWEIGA